MSRTASQIIQLVEEERYEEALGLRSKWGPREVDRALLRESAGHQDEPDVRAALNKAAAALKSEALGPNAREQKRLRSVRRLQSAIGAASDRHDWDEAVHLTEANLKIASRQETKLLRKQLATHLNNRAVAKLDEAGKLIAGKAESVWRRAVEG